MVIKRIGILCFVFLALCNLTLPAGAASVNHSDSITILFTHDMHSHLLPAKDESGCSYGGYARLKTAIDAQK